MCKNNKRHFAKIVWNIMLDKIPRLPVLEPSTYKQVC